MIGQISASNQLRTSSEPVRSQLRTSSELAPNMFGASSELASVMEFGFKESARFLHLQYVHACFCFIALLTALLVLLLRICVSLCEPSECALSRQQLFRQTRGVWFIADMSCRKLLVQFDWRILSKFVFYGKSLHPLFCIVIIPRADYSKYR